MPKTLVLVFHRDLTQSRANAHLMRAASDLPDVEVVDMQARHPGGDIDMFKEAGEDAKMLLVAERIVLQFPIQWYATPALLKTWIDAVLTRMYYVFAEDEGDHLVGTPLMIAATAGNTPEAYTRNGSNFYSIDEILTPLKATAHRCGLPWHAPFVLFEADKLDADRKAHAADRYQTHLRAFIAAANPHAIEETA